MTHYVEDRGEQVPAVEQYDSGWVACPFNCTNETHEHGLTDEPVTHRVAHCPGSKPQGGYFLLRPLLSLLGAVRWWKGSKPVTKPVTGPLGGIGFSDPQGSNGASLLGEVV